MKSFALALLVIIAGATALPQISEYNEVSTREERLVTGVIVAAIESAAQSIRDAGLDPVLVDVAEVNYVIPLVAEFKAFVQDLRFTGLSNIAVNNMDYSVLFNRLRFDVSLPEVRLAVGDSGLSVAIFDTSVGGTYRGSVSVRQIRISGEVRINIGIISGISVQSLSLRFSLGGIQSDVNLNILGRDVSRLVNTLLNDIIPDTLAKYQAQINDTLERIVWAVIDIVM